MFLFNKRKGFKNLLFKSKSIFIKDKKAWLFFTILFKKKYICIDKTSKKIL